MKEENSYYIDDKTFLYIEYDLKKIIVFINDHKILKVNKDGSIEGTDILNKLKKENVEMSEFINIFPIINKLIHKIWPTQE